ncbi:MAG: hypothetical protein AB7U82_08250 [Blastocatellales bacterium]
MADDKDEREDPEANDPNNQPGPDNPVVFTRFGREIRFKRLFKKFVGGDGLRLMTEEEAIAEAEQRAEQDRRIAAGNVGDVPDFTEEDFEIFAAMNRATPEERERALAEGRRLFKEAEAELRKQRAN